MEIWKSPPRAKVYEALTAIADGRVELTSDQEARVVSSTGSKSYDIEWSADRTAFASNDNASYWRGYVGYPILAVLLKLGAIEYAPAVAANLAGIEWKSINQKHGNQYDLAIAEVMTDLERRGVALDPLNAEIDRIFAIVCRMKLTRLPITKAPPAGA